MSLCSKCNKEIDDNTELCDNCSKAVIESEADKKEVSKKKSLLTSVLIGVGVLALSVIASVFFLVNKKQEKLMAKALKILPILRITNYLYQICPIKSRSI